MPACLALRCLALLSAAATVGAQTCPQSGCSTLASTSIELGNGIWLCGNTDTTNSWQSIWSMCNECNNYLLPTVSTLSLRMQQSNVAGTWISPSSWLTAVTAANRDGFGWVVTGQPAGGYNGGGWTSVAQIDAGQTSSLSLARLSLSNAVTHAGWLAMTDGAEVTNFVRGDSDHPDDAMPADEYATDGQYWISMCIDASGQPSPVSGSAVAVGGPYNDTYKWHHLWRRTACTSGLTLAHSPTVCSGFLNPYNSTICSYTCDEGFHVYGSHSIEGSLSDHQHECVFDSTGTEGVFTGGRCVPDSCEPLMLNHSVTNCTGVPLQPCDYECEPGYASSGQQVCNLDGHFAGGQCQAVACQGSTLDNSLTVCSGYTGDECEYVCNDGFVAVGAHICTAAGSFTGGACVAPTGCDNVQWSHREFDACGVCGGDNSTCAGCDGIPFSEHQWDSCGKCSGSYAPAVSIDGHANGLDAGPITVTSSQDVTIAAVVPLLHSACPSETKIRFEWAVANGSAVVNLGSSRHTSTLRLLKNTLIGGTSITLVVTVTAVVEEGELGRGPARAPLLAPWASVSKAGDAIRRGYRSTPNRTGMTPTEPAPEVCIGTPGLCPRTLNRLEDKATANVTITCLRESLIANIKGGNRAVGYATAITLDARDSLDPEDVNNERLQFTYVWACTDLSTQQNCSLPEPPSVDVWSIVSNQASNLVSGRHYKFTLTVVKLERNDSTSVTYYVAPGALPSVIINQRDIRQKYNRNHRLVIVGEVDVAREGGAQKYPGEQVLLTWSAEQLVNGSNWTQLVLAEAVEMQQPWPDLLVLRGLGVDSYPIQSRVSIATPRQAMCSCSRSCNPPLEQVSIQTICSRNLVVNPDNLVSGQRYRFTLTGIGSGGSPAYAEVEVVMNLVPVGGMCRSKCITPTCVSLTQGMAVRDEFHIIADNWEDEDEGVLWYRFGYLSHSGKRSYVSDFSMASQIIAVIPSGAEPHYQVVCTCEVRDQFGGTAYSQDAVVVMPYDVEGGSLAGAAGSRLGAAASTGDMQKSFQLVDAFATTLNDVSSRRRRHLAERTSHADSEDARSVLIDTLVDVTSAGTGGAGRIAMSVASVSAAPEELSSHSTDKALAAVTTIVAGEALDGDAVNGFASAASNLLAASQVQFVSARRRRLAEGNESSQQYIQAASNRSHAIRDIVNRVAIGSSTGKVSGEDSTLISTPAFGMETQRQDASDFVNVSLGVGVIVPPGFVPEGVTGPIDSQVVNWNGDSSPFFWAVSNETNQSLGSEVTSVSFNDLNGSEIGVDGLSQPFVVTIAVPGGTQCPENSTAEFVTFPDVPCVPQQINCSYFDEATDSFVVDGIEINRTNETIVCGFYHLTDLAAVAGPMPSFNPISVDKMLSSDFLFNNPVGFAVGCALFLMLIIAFWWSLRAYFRESATEGIVMNNADVMQTEYALYHTNYKVDKSPSGRGTITLMDRILIKLRMEWDWGGLIYPMPGDPNTRAQRCLVLLAATMFTLLFEIIFFKDPANAVRFCEGDGLNEPPCFTYDCAPGPAYDQCNRHPPEGRLQSVCDPICPVFETNGYLAALFAALCSIPFSRSMGYSFGWLRAPYKSVIDGDDAAGPDRFARCCRWIKYGKQYKRESTAMAKPPEERTAEDIQMLVNLMMQQPLFSDVRTHRDRRDIARVLRFKVVPPHKVIFEHGDLGKEVYSILRGSVCLKLKSPTGALTDAGTISTGSYFGEKAFLGHGRTATIEAAHEDVSLLIVVGDDLDKGVLDRLVASLLPDSELFNGGVVNIARDRWRNSTAKLQAGRIMNKKTGSKKCEAEAEADGAPERPVKDLKTHVMESLERTPRADVSMLHHEGSQPSSMALRPDDLLLSASKLFPIKPGLTPPGQQGQTPNETDESRPAEATPLSQELRHSGDEEYMPKPPVGTASQTGRRARPWAAAYSAAKWMEADSSGAGATVLGRSLNVDLAQKQDRSGNVAVNEGRGQIQTAAPHRRLSVVRAAGLRNLDVINRSDPYAVVYWDDRRVGQTKTVKNTLDPRWNAKFDLPDIQNRPETKLKITVYDHDYTRDEFLGSMEVTISQGQTFGLREIELADRGIKKSKKQKLSCGTISIELRESHQEHDRVVRRRRTPLHEACWRGDHRKLSYLIEDADWKGAVDDRDPDRGWTALHFAVFKGYKNCVRVLLQFSCNVNAKDDNGWTPLMEAAWSGRCKSVLWQVGAGAHVDLQDKDGWTALHAAAHEGNFGCATALIDAGADRIVPDNSGQNAAMVAEQRRFVALAHLIQFGTHDARRRKPVHATLIFSYALLMGFGSWLIIFATTAAFTPETTIRWLTATAFSLVLAMFVFDPIKIVLFGPVYHHMQFILRHKKAVGAIGAVLTAVAYAHEVKETFCPTGR